MARIALTGAGGFLGRCLMALGISRGLSLRALFRSPSSEAAGLGTIDHRYIGDLGSGTLDSDVLKGCDVVIHAAARAHRMGERGVAALESYRRVNVLGTQEVISAMRAVGVRKLVYVSSIKALGEQSGSRALRPDDKRQPEDPYGRSKAEAEDAITDACARGDIDSVIIRPVLVHGPDVRGNLHRLMVAIHAGRRIPFGSVQNRRSLLGVDNLADALLAVAIKQTQGASVPSVCTYNLADDGVISTRRLVEVLAEGMGMMPRLISVPRWLAVGGATMCGRGSEARRLFGDLEVDASAFRRDHKWEPPIGLENGLRLMAKDFVYRMRNDK